MDMAKDSGINATHSADNADAELARVADLFYYHVMSDNRISSLLKYAERDHLTVRLQEFLAKLITGCNIKHGTRVKAKMLEAHFGQLVEVVIHAMRQPFLLGEDIVAASMDYLKDASWSDGATGGLVDLLSKAATERVKSIDAKKHARAQSARRSDDAKKGAKAKDALAARRGGGAAKDLDSQVPSREDYFEKIKAYADKNGGALPPFEISPSQAQAVQESWLMFAVAKGGIPQAEQAVQERLREADPGMADLFYGAEFSDLADKKNTTSEVQASVEAIDKVMGAGRYAGRGAVDAEDDWNRIAKEKNIFGKERSAAMQAPVAKSHQKAKP